MSEDVQSVAQRDPPRTAPRISCFTGESESTDYFIIIEKKLLCKVSSFAEALCTWFASHYVFDLVYPKQTKDVALFFQEYVFGLPEQGGSRSTHSATYLTVSTLLKMWCEDHTILWCEMLATRSTPLSGVIVTPSIQE